MVVLGRSPNQETNGWRNRLWELTLRYVQNGRMIKRRREKGEKKDVFGGGETVRLSETQPTVSPAHELNTQLPYVIIVLCK